MGVFQAEKESAAMNVLGNINRFPLFLDSGGESYLIKSAQCFVLEHRQLYVGCMRKKLTFRSEQCVN